MLYQKEGFPAEGAIVLCTVKKILKNTVFVMLDGYNNQEGIIHISEISPGRIRTIRDYVKENKKVVCKVLRRNIKYNNIELSIRRVTTGQKIKKLQETKLEKRSELIIKTVTDKQKLPAATVIKTIIEPIIKEYGSLFQCFQEVAIKDISPLTAVGIDKKIAVELEQMIKQRFKPQEVTITKKMMLTCPTERGIEAIKDAMKKAALIIKQKKYDAKLFYLATPEYSMKVTAENYKDAESDAEDIMKTIAEEMKKEKGTFEIIKK